MGDPKLNVQINCPKFNWDVKDRYHEWGEFQMDCQNVFDGTYSAIDKAERSATVLNWMGRDALKIVQTLSDDDQKKLRKDVTELFTFFENRFKPEANTILASFQFRQMRRGKLTSDDFMSSLRSKARECGYTDAGRQIREQFTVMIDDTKMQDELLAKLSDTSTPDDALKITRKIEAQRQQKSAIQQEQKEFNAVHRGRGGNRGGRGQDRG